MEKVTAGENEKMKTNGNLNVQDRGAVNGKINLERESRQCPRLLDDAIYFSTPIWHPSFWIRQPFLSFPMPSSIYVSVYLPNYPTLFDFK